MAVRIRLVEGNEMNRDMLSRRLLCGGSEVVSAVDGKSALALAAAVRPVSSSWT